MSWKSRMAWQEAKQRASIINSIRNFFYAKGVVEVETPLLSNGTVTDVFLDAFSTQFDYSDSGNKSSLYLQTSPEFAMKRLIASGYECIYQLSKAFRHEQVGRHHNPEFSMLEWYRINFDHYQLMDEVSELLVTVLNCEPCDKVTYQRLFKQHLAIDPLSVTLAELKLALAKNKVYGDWINSETDKDMLLQVLFSECIEAKLGNDRPVFVYDYPRSQASLAKISKKDPRVAERFECYFKGVELANGFHELTDADEQLARFKLDNLKRESLGKPTRPIDSNFIEALKTGLPECSGVALGVDRLMMLAMDCNSIDQAMTFIVDNA